MFAQYKKQFARFSADIASHTVTVLRDDGLYRHLRCRRDDSYVYGFDVITWPGYLAYTGDMGCFVFTRLPDMFGFFRGRREALVDRGYLAEKCVAGDKTDGVREYSADLFRRAVKTDFDSYAEDLDDVDRADMWSEIETEVLPRSDDGLQMAVQSALDFVYRGHDGCQHVPFTDFWEHRLEDYTTRFWWCCYAIPWAIKQYDALHEPQACGVDGGAHGSPETDHTGKPK
jgi:hypothetical protein